MNWPTKTLGEVCDFQGGGTPSKAVARYWQGDIPWVSPKDMKFDVVSDSIDHISQEAIDSSATSLVPENAILVVVRSGILARTVPIAIAGRPLTINQDLKALCPNATVDSRFLYRVLQSKMDSLLSMVSQGATVHRLATEQIRALKIVLPPLPEQQRIVGILDKAFEAIATAKANTERNLQNTHALFESHLQAVFTQRGEGWMETPLGNVSRINYGYTESARAEKVGPHFLRITDIQNNMVDWATVPYCPISASDQLKYKLVDGDIVFARTGATTGKSYLVRDPPESVFASYLIRVQLTDKNLLPNFVNLFFQTHSYWKSIRAGVSGSTQGGFNASKLAELVIPYPRSPSDQAKIVARLEDVLIETERLAATQRRKLAALDELRKSLLHHTFRGTL